ncbi:MAG TPA: DinB family protein [Pyrinomonadaceae bacterium]|nr:DinB family protein [Pyrinomonadaceae bacterium]
MTKEELASLIEFLKETPRVVRQSSENLSDEQRRWKPAEDEFSTLENVCHLRDIELEGYSVRIEKLLNEEKPFLHDLDGARLAKERDYNVQDFNAALLDFSEARAENARKLESLAVEQLSRSGEFEGVGEISLEKLVLMMRDHDDGHRQELSDLCNRINSRR